MAKQGKSKGSRKGGGRTRSGRVTKGRMVFTRRNYILMVVGVALIVVGYIIMRVDNQVDGFVSLYLAPLIILGGYLEIIYAILWQPKEVRVVSVDTGKQSTNGA